MIGRGIFENPFIFNHHAQTLAARPPQEKLQLLLRHIELFEQIWQGQKPFRILKKYFKIYVQSFYGASELRARLVESDSAEEVRCHIMEWLKNDPSRFVHAS